MSLKWLARSLQRSRDTLNEIEKESKEGIG